MLWEHHEEPPGHLLVVVELALVKAAGEVCIGKWGSGSSTLAGTSGSTSGAACTGSSSGTAGTAKVTWNRFCIICNGKDLCMLCSSVISCLCIYCDVHLVRPSNFLSRTHFHS